MSNIITINDKNLIIEGNIYVISDIHACLYTLKKILKKIKFNNDDYLVINGDLIDRGGPHNLELVKYISSFNNICLIRGNHEEFYLRADINELDYSQWYAWGGKNTIMELKRASIDDRLFFHNYIVKTPLFATIKIDEKEFFVSHNGFNLNLDIIKKNDIILNKETVLTQYNKDWFNFFISSDINFAPKLLLEKHWIVGHYPTLNIINESKIYKRKMSTHIDCGATYDYGCLGILCLNKNIEYYEKIDRKDL